MKTLILKLDVNLEIQHSSMKKKYMNLIKIEMIVEKFVKLLKKRKDYRTNNHNQIYEKPIEH